MTNIPQDVFAAPVEGINLAPGTLGDQIGADPTLLVFLRHFGCPFCKETVGDLRQISGDNFVPVIFVAQGRVEEVSEFFNETSRWPQARVVADPEKKLYAAMGLRQGSVGQIFGLQVWTCAVRAMSKGHFIGKPVGDPWLMPGAYLLQRDRILWSYPYRHQGDRPDWAKVLEHLPAPQRAQR